MYARNDFGIGDDISQLDFGRLYEEGVGRPLFRILKDTIKQSKLYDYVLIDSRTGFSDESGICTRDLADHNFVIMGLNNQNVDGTARFLRSLRASTWKGGQVVFAVSPVPSGYEELRDSRLASAKKAIEEAGFEADLSLRIPYHPRLALDEEPFEYRWSETDLFAAYNHIQRKLRELADDSPKSWPQKIITAIQNEKFDDALLRLRELAIEMPELVGPVLSFAVRNLFKESPLRAGPFFDTWLAIAGEDLDVLKMYWQHLAETEQFEEANQILSNALEEALTQRNKTPAARVRLMLGEFFFRTNKADKALEQCQLALPMFEDADEQEGITNSLLLKATILQEKGDYKSTLEVCEQALPYAKASREEHLVSAVHSTIGSAHLNLGNYRAALEASEMALEIAERYNDLEETNVARMRVGQIEMLQGKYPSALHHLEAALSSIPKHNKKPERSCYIRFLIARTHFEQENYDFALASYEGLLKDAHLPEDLLINIPLQIAKVRLRIGPILVGQQGMLNSLKELESFSEAKKEEFSSSIRAGRLGYSDALLRDGHPKEASTYLNHYWESILGKGQADARAGAYLQRAKIRAALKDTQGAAKDAQLALDFYQSQDVHNLYSRETEDLVEAGKSSQVL